MTPGALVRFTRPFAAALHQQGPQVRHLSSSKERLHELNERIKKVQHQQANPTTVPRPFDDRLYPWSHSTDFGVEEGLQIEHDALEFAREQLLRENPDLVSEDFPLAPTKELRELNTKILRIQWLLREREDAEYDRFDSEPSSAIGNPIDANMRRLITQYRDERDALVKKHPQLSGFSDES